MTGKVKDTLTPPQAILSHLHKKPRPEPPGGVKTVLTRASVLWHCRLSFETDREMEILMPKAEWGVKRTCLGCGARFYDLKRTPIICPKCEVEFDIAVAPKPRRAKPAAAAKAAVKAAVKAADEKTEDLIDDADVDADADSNTDIESDDPVLETDDDDGDVIVAKGAGDDDDSESIDEDVLLDATDDDTADDADDAGEDENLGDAKTGGGKSKDK